MLSELLHRIHDDPYPRLKAWRRFHAVLESAEARLFRFILMPMRLRSFAVRSDDAAEFDALLAGMAANLIEAGVARDGIRTERYGGA